MKKLLFIMLVLFFVTGSALADMTIVHNAYKTQSIRATFPIIDYGTPEAPDLKDTTIFRVVIKSETDTGAGKLVFKKFFDRRGNNPDGYDRIVGNCRYRCTTDAEVDCWPMKNCYEWMADQTGQEFLDIIDGANLGDD